MIPVEQLKAIPDGLQAPVNSPVAILKKTSSTISFPEQLVEKLAAFKTEVVVQVAQIDPGYVKAAVTVLKTNS